MDPRTPRRIEIVVALLLVVSLLLEACGGAPASDAAGARQDARMLLLAIHSLALGEEDVEDAGLVPGGSGALMRRTFLPEAGPIDEVKAAIQDVEAECARARGEIENLLPEADKSEEIAALEEACQAELAKLQTTLRELRRARDKSYWRRTKVGRGLAFAWQTVKKNRRAIALALVTGGASLAKKALIDAGRAALRAEARMQIGRFLARKGISPEFLERVNLSPGGWPPRRAGSGGRTASDESEGAGEPPASIDELLSTDSFQLPADGLWTATCRHRYPEDWTIEWTIAINLMAGSFTSHAEWTRVAVEQGGWLYSYQLAHEGLGEISEDGMLQGPFREVTTLVWSKGGVVSDPQKTEAEGRMYGVISADLKTICLSRGEDPGAYDVEYIRRIGREAFFGPDAGCEAECTITQGP